MELSWKILLAVAGYPVVVGTKQQQLEDKVESMCCVKGVWHVQVPMAATVYCQPIQMRTEWVLGFDMAQANQWRWRPDYEGLDLGDIRQARFCAPRYRHFHKRVANIYTGPAIRLAKGHLYTTVSLSASWA